MARGTWAAFGHGAAPDLGTPPEGSDRKCHFRKYYKQVQQELNLL